MLLALPLLKDNRISLVSFCLQLRAADFTAYITQIFFSVLRKNQLHVIDTRAADLFPQVKEERHDGLLPPARFTQRLHYRELQYAYDPGKPVLDRTSLMLKQGRRWRLSVSRARGKVPC